jgi:hypothetical protein
MSRFLKRAYDRAAFLKASAGFRKCFKLKSDEALGLGKGVFIAL